MSAIDDQTSAEGSRAFSVGVAVEGSRGTVRPRGELDLATAPEVERRALALWAEGAETVALDLSEVTFFDSSALRLLMRLQARAEEERRALALRAPSPPVLRVLELTRLDGQFAVETDAL